MYLANVQYYDVAGPAPVASPANNKLIGKFKEGQFTHVFFTQIWVPVSIIDGRIKDVQAGAAQPTNVANSSSYGQSVNSYNSLLVFMGLIPAYNGPINIVSGF